MTFLSSVVHLVEKKSVGQDLQRLRFSPPENNTKSLGLFPCEYISIKHPTEENYVRHYSVASPVTKKNNKYIDIILKEKSGRPTKSIMVAYLLTRTPEDEVLMKIGGGYQYKPNTFKDFCFLVGGSGVSPAYQKILEKVHCEEEEEDKTNIHVLFGSPLLSQLLFREDLGEISKKEESVNVHFTLDRPPTEPQLKEAGLEEWKGLTGFITEDKIKKFIPPPPSSTNNDLMILVSGPYGMVKFLKGFLPKLGYTEEMTFYYM